MRHDSLGEARAVASGARLFLWLAGGGWRIAGAVGGSLLATWPADRTAQEFRLILHHVEALATTRSGRLAGRDGGLDGLDDRLRLFGYRLCNAGRPLDRCLLGGLAAILRPFCAVEALGTVLPLLPLAAVLPILTLGPITAITTVAPITAVEPAVTEAGIVAAILAMVLLAAVLRAPIVVLATVVVTAVLVAGLLTLIGALFGPRVLARLTVLAGLARECRHRGLLAHAGIDGLGIIAVGVLAVLVHGPHPMTIGTGHVTVLLHLFAVGDDHAIVVFGVLEIVLREHGVARGLSVARQRHVFARDIRRGAADFYVRTVGFEATG